MIKDADIRNIVTRELGNYLVPLGYKPVKVKSDMVASFAKNDGGYYYDFYSFTNKYNEYQLVYGFSFGINKIVRILNEIEAHVPLLKGKYTIKDSITGMSPGQMLDPLAPTRAYKYFSKEEELLKIIGEIKYFYQENFIPFCGIYSDIAELDRLINSPSDFWADSKGKSIPIDFFHVTRLVIAALTKNPLFDEIVEKNFEVLEEIWKKEGAIYDRNDHTKPEVYAASYLEEKFFAK